jgi:hypothetical protein
MFLLGRPPDMEGTQRITDDLDRLCRVAASSNKAHQFAACGRRTPFSLRLRLHYKGAVVRWR